jgi:hypothetical protein
VGNPGEQPDASRHGNHYSGWLVLLLTSTSDKVQVITSSTAGIDVHASFVDLASGTVTTGRLNTKITTATTTDVVASPAASTTRNVKALHIANIHASTSNDVTIQHTDGTNVVQLEKVTLLAGERISYREGVGMRIIDSSGMEKSPPAIAGQYTTQRLGADVSNATTTAAKVTGLDLVCGPGTWVFEYFLRLRSTATATTGWKLSVNHSGTVTIFLATQSFPQTNTVDSAGTGDQDITAAPTVMATMAQRAKSTAATMIATGGVDTTSADILVQITGLTVVTVGGNMELYHASETAANTSVMADSLLRLTKFA